MSSSKVIDLVLNSLIPSLTAHLSIAAQSARDAAQTMLTQGAGLITKTGEISRNPQAFGFTFEHLHAIGFNLNAALQGSDARAYQIPADGSTKFSPDIYVELTGKIIETIQAKTGFQNYIKQHTRTGNHTGNILVNGEQELAQAEADKIIKIATDSLKQGFVRGLRSKSSNALPIPKPLPP